MKKFLVLFLMVIPLVAFSATIVDLFQSAQASNTTFTIAQLNLKLANMNYDKAMIQASNKGEKLSAELNHVSSLISYTNNLKGYYEQIDDAVFKVLTSEIDLEVGKLNLQAAIINYNNSESLFKKSLISENDLKEVSITASNSQNQLKNLEWEYNDAVKNFKQTTGSDWKDIEISIPKFESLPASQSVWMKNDLSVESADLNLQIAQYNLQNIPSNSSEYTKEIAQIQVKKSEINYENAQLSSEESFLSSKQNLEFTYTSLLNSKKSLEISYENLKDMKLRYDQGLVSETDYINQRIQYLNAKENYYKSLNKCWNALCTYLISFNLKPEEALK